jgi:hypothetical protein
MTLILPQIGGWYSAGSAVDAINFASGHGGLKDITASQMNFGSGPYTYETWFNTPISPGAISYMQVVGSGFATNSSSIYLQGASYAFWSNGAERISTASYTANLWTHVAVTVQSNTATMWVGGAQITTGGSIGNVTTTELYVGANPGGSTQYQGLLYKPRVSSGARYTSAFTPDTDYTVDGTTLFMPGADSASGIYDAAGNATLVVGSGVTRDLTGAKP